VRFGPGGRPSVSPAPYGLCVSHRPLALLSGLTLGDYLLWNWSLSANHDVLALVAGLSLLPLALACLWLLAVSVARVLARSTLRARAAAAERRRAQHPRRAAAAPFTGVPAGKSSLAEQSPAPVTSPSVPTRGELAA
jgi:hypothetical protein